MSPPIYGRVTSAKVFTGRVDLVAVTVVTNTAVGSGVFNCDPENVTLNGEAAIGAVDVVRFVTTKRECRATVNGAQPDLAGTGYTPCESIALTALE